MTNTTTMRSYESMKVAELKKKLLERKLLTSGKKAELIKRLKKFDATEPSIYYPNECLNNRRMNLPKHLEIIQSTLNKLGENKEAATEKQRRSSFDEDNYKGNFPCFNLDDIDKKNKQERKETNHKEAKLIEEEINKLKEKKEKELKKHRKIIREILNQELTKDEIWDRDFYRSLGNPASCKELLSDIFQKLNKKEDFWKNGNKVAKEFDSEMFFLLLRSLRLLEHCRTKNPDDVPHEIPNIVKKYRKWYKKIGKSKKTQFSVKKKEEKNLIFLVFKNNVPKLIRIYLITRFVLRRNKALSGKRNFKGYSKIIGDGYDGIDYAENLLKSAEKDWDEIEYLSNIDFITINSIERSLFVQKMLFKIRVEKNPDEIIKFTTETLGLVLTHKNKILKGISSFWCYHVLWRCFLCIGDYETAISFKIAAESISQQLENLYDINYSKKFEMYEEDIPKKYKKQLIESMYEEDIPKKYKKQLIESVSKFSKENKTMIFSERKELYVEFIGYDNHERKGKKGRPRNIFGTRFLRRGQINDGKEMMEEIAKYFEEVLHYLRQSKSIVSIPSIRLVIIDILFMFSRVSMVVNNPKKDIDKVQWEECKDIWRTYVKSISIMVESLIETRDNLANNIGKEKVIDFDYIIKKLEENKDGKKGFKPYKFRLKEVREVLGGAWRSPDSPIKDISDVKKISSYHVTEKDFFRPQDAGKKIQEMLKNDITNPKWKNHVPLHFPLRVKNN